MPRPPEDPFLSVQRDVQTSWTSISASFSQYRQAATLGAPTSASARELLKTQLHSLDWDLQDLAEAVRVAEDDPARFALTRAQVTARARFVADMTRQVQDVRAALGNEGETTGNVGDRRETLLDMSGGRGEGGGGGKGDAQYIGEEVGMQERMMEEQDEDLEHLASAVERIGLMGQEMHEELAEHGEMLDGLAGEMEETSGRMAAVREKLDRFVAETGPREFCTILGLCATFLILTVLVATT